MRNAWIAVMMMVLVSGPALAQGKVAVTDADRFDRMCDNAPSLVREALVQVLTQEQVAQVEAILFPPPTPEEKRELLETAEKLLRAATVEKIADDVALERAKYETPKEDPGDCKEIGEIAP